MSDPPKQHLDNVAVAILIGVCATWGLNQIAVKVANEGMSPVWQAAMRSAGAAVLVWAWAAYQGVRVLRNDGTWLPGIAAGVLFGVEFLLYYWGMVYTTASRGVLFFYMSPFFVALGAHFFVPGERLTTTRSLGLVLAFAGVSLVFADGLRLPTRREVTGDLLVFVAAALWGATTVLIKSSALARISAHRILLYQLVVSALVLTPISLAIGEPGLFGPTPLVVGAFAFQTVLVVPVSYLTWFWLMTRYPASKLAAFTFLTPLFGVAFGVVLLGDPLTPALAAAAVLVALGIYLVNRRG